MQNIYLKNMQKIVRNYPSSTSLNPLKDSVGVSGIDYSAKFEGLYKRYNTVKSFLKKKKNDWRVDEISPWFSNTSISRSTKRYATKKSICGRYV